MMHYIEYLLQTIALHRLIDLGMGDDPIADRLRDAMEFSYRRLTRNDLNEIEEVSARLNLERDCSRDNDRAGKIKHWSVE